MALTAVHRMSVLRMRSLEAGANILGNKKRNKLDTAVHDGRIEGQTISGALLVAGTISNAVTEYS